MGVRAKFRCNTENTKVWNRRVDGAISREYEFSAVYDDGTPENQRYAKATPVGRLTITVDNPAVVFDPGKDYYLDLVEVVQAD